MADRPRAAVGRAGSPRPGDAAKSALDALLALALLLQMARHFFPDAVHEALGIALGVFALIHVALNRGWFARLARGPWNALRVAQTAVNLATVVLLLLTVASGIGVSEAVPGLSGVLRPSAMRGVHMACVYSMLLLFSLHLGMQWTRVMARVRRLLGAYTAPLPVRAALRAAALALAAWGAYELVALGILDYVTLRTQFAFIDTSRPLVPHLLPYAAVIVLCAWAGHYLCALLAAIGRRRRRGRTKND